MTIIERILIKLEEKSIKQIELAKRLNIDKSIVTNWKKRNCNPPAEFIPHIANLLDVSIEWLITGEENEINLTTTEKKIIENLRKLDGRDKAEILDLIRIKIDRMELIDESHEYRIG